MGLEKNIHSGFYLCLSVGVCLGPFVSLLGLTRKSTWEEHAFLATYFASNPPRPARNGGLIREFHPPKKIVLIIQVSELSNLPLIFRARMAGQACGVKVI